MSGLTTRVLSEVYGEAREVIVTGKQSKNTATKAVVTRVPRGRAFVSSKESSRLTALRTVPVSEREIAVDALLRSAK